MSALSNSYLDLPQALFERAAPTPVREPRLLLWNAALAQALGGLPSVDGDPAAIAEVFGGNRLLPGCEPIALAYAGHQFGHFVPQLGDGRAHLLGEVVDPGGARRDLQLKGSGRTSFSRGGDGRCALGPALREYIMGEAMHALGIPTTRGLAVVATGEPVVRAQTLPGAVVTRVASSHVRVGTFEYLAARGKTDALRALMRFVIARHYPELEQQQAEAQPLALLDRVIERQITLVVHWMRVGFIHGVMNTDNTALSGQTIDYGPCAMMSHYSPQTVFSSIDHGGRYAFGNQPAIAHWNLTRLAECLVPLIDDDPSRAVELATPLIDGFPARFEAAYLQMMRRKLGLASEDAGDGELIASLLQILEAHGMDYTVTFERLQGSLTAQQAAVELRPELGPWLERWRERRARADVSDADAAALMRASNPLVIPRNHHVEAVLERATEHGELEPAERLLEVVRAPYEVGPHTHEYQDPPPDGDRGYQTFCGT